MPDTGAKRKQTNDAGPPKAKRARFPLRPGRNITSTSTNNAYPNGELNVAKFMRARENEIKALENAMKLAKRGLSRRAFQEVPRDMRRRTGSHNPQRVPKRLRMKAKQEAIIDNTPISKNKSGSGIGKGARKWLREQGIEKSKQARARREKAKKAKEDNKVTVTEAKSLGPTSSKGTISSKGSTTAGPSRKVQRPAKLAKPAMPPSRFRRRQLHKTWLPTHVWHAKRATMTAPKEPLWRFALPLAPIAKSYRLTHRAISARGAIAWDMSYMSTIGLEGVQDSLQGLLRGLHFAQEDGERPWQHNGLGLKWRNGTRSWEGWICERESQANRIAPVTVIWAAPNDVDNNKRKMFIRVHPSGFLQLWNEVLRIAKVQKPAVTVEDLRYEIGSIEVMGPAAIEALCAILQPAPSQDTTNTTADSGVCTWPSLASVTDIGALPKNAIIAYDVYDPRLRDPIRTFDIAPNADSAEVLGILADWPPDKAHAETRLFERNARLAAGRMLPSQKSINRRKSAAMPGHVPVARVTDPQIPMLAYASASSRTWSVLLPWKCVLPVWRCLMRYAVSTGGNPTLGGVTQRRQVDYERSKPSFPFDFPGTNAGWVWEQQQRVERREEWTRRPKGKRVEWSTITLNDMEKGEIGQPWACAWEKLIPSDDGAQAECDADAEPLPLPFRQASLAMVMDATTRDSSRVCDGSKPWLFIARLSMVQKGVPTACARVYRLPSDEARKQWLALLPGAKGNTSRDRRAARVTNANAEEQTSTKQLSNKALAASLLRPGSGHGGHAKVGTKDYPAVPLEIDLIGFVTTGNYNLAEGMPTAIANLALDRVRETAADGKWKGRQLCIVREAGQTFGRLATWEAVA